MKVWLEKGVLGDDGDGWTAIREHAKEHRKGVDAPVKVRVGHRVESRLFQHFDASHRSSNVRVWTVSVVVGLSDQSYGLHLGICLRGHMYLSAGHTPVSALITKSDMKIHSLGAVKPS